MAKSESGELIGGLADMHRGADLLREQDVLSFDGLLMIALAETEARAGGIDRALAILDEGVATAERAGYDAFKAELHRARGGMLLKRHPANLATAEEAFQTAIVNARRQATRSFELRAAPALAKLSQSTGRLADAYAVLAPAAEGFSPTPEIAQAQALLERLAHGGEGRGVREADPRTLTKRRLARSETRSSAAAPSRGMAVTA